MSKALPAGRSWPSLPDLDLIASQTRLIIRNSRKFTAAGFLQSLLSSVATGLASLNQIAGDLKDRDHPGMARQSLHERFDIRSTAFLMAVLGDLMQQRYSTAATAIGSCGIQRAASGIGPPDPKAGRRPSLIRTSAINASGSSGLWFHCILECMMRAGNKGKTLSMPWNRSQFGLLLRLRRCSHLRHNFATSYRSRDSMRIFPVTP